jgi:hypothetical protein
LQNNRINFLTVFFNNLILDEPEEISYKMVGIAGVCELAVTENSININFVATQAREIMDSFSIIKN